MADLPFPPAPPSADDSTVILWVVGALVTCLGIAVLALWRHIEARHKETQARHVECESRNQALANEVKVMRDRLFDDFTELAERGIVGLAHSTAAIKRFLGEKDDTPTDPLPALRHRRDL